MPNDTPDFDSYSDADLAREARYIARQVTALDNECRRRGLDLDISYTAGEEGPTGSDGNVIMLGAGFNARVTRTIQL